jgi:hypothetical protein
MKLSYNWKTVLKRAWSIRLMIVAALLSGVEVILPFFSGAIPKGTFAALSFLAVSSAFVARLVAQKDLDHAQ